MLYIVIPQLPGIALLNPKAVLYKKLTVAWCSECVKSRVLRIGFV